MKIGSREISLASDFLYLDALVTWLPSSSQRKKKGDMAMEIKDKKPKKPLIFYYAIVIIVLVLLNTLLVPSLAERSIKEATYDEFLDTLDSGTVEEVNLEDDVIYYSVKKGNETQVDKTGRIKDSQEVERLKDAGVKFSEEIPQKTSPILSFFLSYIVPIQIYEFIGYWLSKKMMSGIGGSARK